MKPYLAFGGIMILIGAALIFAPILLPRSWFGEVGHGDGMGLIIIMLLGALAGGLGLLSVLGGVFSALFNRKTKETV